MNKKLYAWTGAALAVASTAMIIGYAVRKTKEQAVCAGVLLAGIAGLVGGALIAYRPEKARRKQLTLSEVLDEEDARLVDESIAELLGNGVGVADES